MKRSGIKKKVVDPTEQKLKMEKRIGLRQIRAARGNTAFSRMSIKSRKVWYKDVQYDSIWELDGFRYDIELRIAAGKITDYNDHVTVTFKVFNEAGEFLQKQINIDFQYFDKDLNRWVRRDRKSTKKLVKKRQPDWLLRWELMKFAEPDFQYELEYMG